MGGTGFLIGFEVVVVDSVFAGSLVVDVVALSEVVLLSTVLGAVVELVELSRLVDTLGSEGFDSTGSLSGTVEGVSSSEWVSVVFALSVDCVVPMTEELLLLSEEQATKLTHKHNTTKNAIIFFIINILPFIIF